MEAINGAFMEAQVKAVGVWGPAGMGRKKRDMRRCRDNDDWALERSLPRPAPAEKLLYVLTVPVLGPLRVTTLGFLMM